MLDHFLAVGGNEVVNSARAYGYATTGDCPADWLADPDCDTLAQAVGHSPYDRASIADAPWYDPDDADTSARFLGAYGVDLLNLSDSTRQADVTQRSGDGAIVSGYRHGSREVRVRTWLTAIGMDAMELGMTWLRNVLDPDACGQHGGSCGQADAAFFVDCPPGRRDVEQFTEWQTIATNLVTNPRVETDAVGFASTGTWAAAPTRRLPFPAIPHPDPDHLEWCYGGTDTGASETNQNIRYDLGSLPIGQYRVGFWAKVAGTGAATARLANNTALNPSFEASNLTLNDQWAWKAFSFTVGATSNVYLGIYGQGATDFDAEMSGLILVAGAGDPLTPEDYFDGATPGEDDLERNIWTGTADASTSQRQSRTSFIGPESDESYAAYIDGWRRFLHSVQCVSGPFVVQERKSNTGPHVGRLVEFTLIAEVPWVYGAPKEIDVPPIVPSVMQDIGYNLAPYPSAELSEGTVVVATNYSTNPSVETNSTGWLRHAGSGAITAAMVTAGARVTGELAAVGTASFCSVFTATGASASSGNWYHNQEVALGGPAGARYSVNIWSAASVASGAPVGIAVDVIAYWRSSSEGTVLREDRLGTIDPNGGAVSAKSILPPVGATHVLVRSRITIASWNAGTIVRFYSDALAVTVP